MIGICQVSLAAEVTVTMANWEFSPKVVNIEVGDTVIFENNDDSIHSVIFPDESIQSLEVLKMEKKFLVKFEKVGEFPFFCKQHKDFSMNGKVIVLPKK
ncbi:MAG: hypothetical protein A3H99_12970 [Gallionellales bacterium RIFCSPLOWO2_02_FULL_59_110]|nr:MAG: hypothetical protein A3H99_12970 [Gallionellales bacterium RIFCSPLOWO2_02_FULL_59_110]